MRGNTGISWYSVRLPLPQTHHQHEICGFAAESVKEVSLGAGPQNRLAVGVLCSSLDSFLSESSEQVGKPDLFTQRPSLYCASNGTWGLWRHEVFVFA